MSDHYDKMDHHVTIICSRSKICSTGIISSPAIISRSSWAISSYSSSRSIASTHPWRRRGISHRSGSHVLAISSTVGIPSAKVGPSSTKVPSTTIVIGIASCDATCSRSIVTNELDRKNCKARRIFQLVLNLK